MACTRTRELRLAFSILMFILTFQSKISFAQNSTDPTPIRLEPLPPSPQAASLGRYGQVPVGYSTGVANISIPIHQLNLGDFTYGISLNYHSMGNKVDEISSRY